MKISFICGCLEMGRDGVGDYTRLLAAQMILQGHQAEVVAFNDPYVNEELNGTQVVNGITLPVLRMPSTMGGRHRFKRAKEWIDRFGPDWISLQFVPYAFHHKGLPLLMVNQFKGLLLKKRSVHIMFHETWVGTENRWDWKRLVTATLQKTIIKKLIRSLRPGVIHTQLPKTYSDLVRITPEVKKLPLFSNIEVAARWEDQKQGILRVGFFSQAEASEPIVAFLTSLGNNAREVQVQLELLLIGGNPSRMKTVGDALEKIGILENHISYTGFLAPAEISQALQSCSLGITAVPRHALGKSGSVAAFITHGIPVAAPTVHQSQDPMEIGFFSADLRSAVMLEPDLISLKIARAAAVAARNEIQVSAITKKFIADLQFSSDS